MSEPSEVWALLAGKTDRILMELTNKAERAHDWRISWNSDMVVRYVPESELIAANERAERLQADILRHGNPRIARIVGRFKDYEVALPVINVINTGAGADVAVDLPIIGDVRKDAARKLLRDVVAGLQDNCAYTPSAASVLSRMIRELDQPKAKGQA